MIKSACKKCTRRDPAKMIFILEKDLYACKHCKTLKKHDKRSSSHNKQSDS